MNKRKKIVIVVIVVAVVVVLAAICGGNSGTTDAVSTDTVKSETTTNEAAKDDSAASEKSKTPTVNVDTMMDDIKVTSYTVDGTGVTLELSYDSSETNLVYAEVTSFEYGGKEVAMNYDSAQDKYAAVGVTFELNGAANDFGSIELKGGSTATVKFSVDGFDKPEDYDGFVAHFYQKYSGTFNGEIKDDYIKVSVS